MKTISLITPCFNEEAGIRECYETIKQIFAEHLPDYKREHIFCDNCSTDSTVDILKSIAAEDPSVKIIVNSRNFGILRNTFNGVMSATGDAVMLFVPADLQDPPELIPQFVKLWEQGFEIVFGLRAERQEPFLLRTARKVYYRLLSRLSYVDYPPDAGDFQLIDRKVLEAMRQFKDQQPFMRMMTFDCGFRSVGVPYVWRARKHGVSRNRFWQLMDQALTGLISFSNAPMRLALFAGLGIVALSLAFVVFVLAMRLIFGEYAPRGTTTVIAAIFLFNSITLVFIGLLGEYIVAIFNQVRGRPLVIERERVNFDGP